MIRHEPNLDSHVVVLVEGLAMIFAQLKPYAATAAVLRKHEITLVTAALFLSVAFGLIPAGARFFAALFGWPQ